MFIIPSIDLSMKLSLSEVFVSNIIVTMVISNKSCCKHVLFTNLSDFISTTTRVTSLKSKKFLFCSFSVAKFGIAPQIHHKYLCDGSIIPENVGCCANNCQSGLKSLFLLVGFVLDLFIIPHRCFHFVFLVRFLPILLMRHGVVIDRVFPSTYLLPGLHQSSE